MNGSGSRWVGGAAVAGVVLGVVLTPLHAMARHATAEGRADLELPGTRAWSEPLSEALRPLLDWSDAQTVYVTYGKGWVLVFGAALLCALAVRRRRDPRGAERWSWPVALTAYGLLTAAMFVSYWIPSRLDTAFTVLGIPSLLLTVVGSTALGVALLRRRFQPRGTAWLLALTLPLLLALGQVVSFGGALMPVVIAWAVAGRRLGGAPVPRSAGTGGRLHPRSAEVGAGGLGVR